MGRQIASNLPSHSRILASTTKARQTPGAKVYDKPVAASVGLAVDAPG
jgi:hypothetical protein